MKMIINLAGRSAVAVRFFIALAVVLSDVMCATVAYNYCAFQWGGKYEGWSAPPDVAFVSGIPYAVGIVICLILARICHKREQKQRER